MLNENLKQLRKSKGLTQEEFALQLGVVRQTISKWEKGLSVPDSEMLIEISERFDVPVSTLLGDTIEPAEKEDLIKIMSDKLALINEQLANAAERKRRITRSLSFAGIAVAACYLAGYYHDPCLCTAVFPRKRKCLRDWRCGWTDLYFRL